MAEQIATGYEASNSGGNGEGAIIFDNTETLNNLNRNLSELDEVQAARLKMRKESLAASQKFLSGLNPDLNGIFPGDKDAILAETNKLQQAGVAHLKEGRNPENQSDLLRQKENVMALVQVSKARNKAIAAGVGVIDRDGGAKFDVEKAHTKLAMLSGVPLNELSANPDKYFNGIIQTKASDIDDVLSEFVKKSGTKYTNSAIVHPKGSGPNEIWINDVSANMNPGQMDDLSKNYRNYPKILEASNAAWESIKEQTPGMVSTMTEPYLKAGLTPVQAEQKAQDDWMHGKVLYHSAMSNKLHFGGLNEQGRINIMRQREALTEDKNILYGPAMMYANIMSQQPGAYTALLGVSPSQQTYREVVLDEDGKPSMDANGKPIYGPAQPNVVTGVDYLPNGGVAIRTSATDAVTSEQNWKYYTDPATGKIKMEVKAPAVIFNKNQTRELATFMDANKTNIDLNNIDKAYRKIGAVDEAGNVDPAKYVDRYTEVFGSGETKKPATKPKAPVKQIKEADIATKARAAGYTEAEYRKLLTDKGVQIVK